MLLGKYRLKERLGVGGMAEVFRADVLGFGGFSRPVALKKILPQFLAREDFQKMFIDEARICASLTHANLVQIFDFERAEDGTYFLTMELVEGVDLRRLLEAIAPKPLPATIALLIASEVLKGLAYAHERVVHGEHLRLIHRDVTPSNILLSWAGEIKLSDFGLAKAKARLFSTQPGIIKGKFAYLAPEQLQSGEIDHRVDLFCLGIVLWEMLTGQRLYSAESDADTIKKLLEVKPKRPSRLCSTVPKACDKIVLSLLAHQRKKRYQSAREALQQIGDLLHLLATENEHVDLAGFLQKVFSKELQESQTPIIPQKVLEEEETRQIDIRKFQEFSKTVPNISLASPIFEDALKKSKKISKKE